MFTLQTLNPSTRTCDPIGGSRRFFPRTSRDSDMNTKLLLLRSLLAVATGLMLHSSFAAGQIDLVDGNVSVTTVSGQTRAPAKGERIEAGDAISTGRGGEIHVRMDDNALIALRSNSFLKIEAYKADGNADDSAVFRLLRGSLRSITGWIGKNNPQRYALYTPTATVGIRGTDHETLVVENGTEAGTYDKVNTGETELLTTHGKVAVLPGKAAFASKAGQAPVVLASIPALFVPGKNEAAVETSKKALEDTRDERWLQKQKDNERAGGGRTGSPKIGDPEEARKALIGFENFLRAFEAGDVSTLRQRLDPAMIGYQQLLDNITYGNNECKQMRVNLFNTQVQAGPDLAVVQTSWEKRCLYMPTFSPKLASGRATVLLHRGANGWQFAAITAGNMFDRFAVSVTPPTTPTGPTTPTTPGTTPVTPVTTTPGTSTPVTTTPGTTPGTTSPGTSTPTTGVVTPPTTTTSSPTGTGTGTTTVVGTVPPTSTPSTPAASCFGANGGFVPCPTTSTPASTCVSVAGALAPCTPASTPTTAPPASTPTSTPATTPTPVPVRTLPPILTCTVSGRTVPCSSIRNTSLCTRRGTVLICP